MNVVEPGNDVLHREASFRKAILHLAVAAETESALRSIMASLRKELGAEACSIFTLDEKEEALASAPIDFQANGRQPESTFPVSWSGSQTAEIKIYGASVSSDAQIAALEDAGLFSGLVLEHSRLRASEERTASQGNLLLRATEKIGMAMSVDDVIRAYLDQVASNGRYFCTIVLYEFDQDGQKVGNIVRGRWSPGGQAELMNHRVPTKRDFLDPILASGKTVAIANALTNTEIPKSLREEQRRDNRPAVALIPLMAEAKRIGLVILSDVTPHEWTDEELLPFQATANQLAAGLTSRRDHDARIESNRRFAVLEERRKIARDLHDSVTQILFSLNLLAQTLEPDVPPPNEIIERINQLSRKGLQDMRSLLEELRPVQTDADRPTLPQRIVAYVSTLVGFGEFKLDYASYQPQESAIEEQLLRIAQEALNNVAKHAHAQLTQVTLQSDRNRVKLIVEDDGVGLHEESIEKSKSGLGLDGMRERARELRAQFEIHSQPGQGTKILVALSKGEAK